MFVFSVEQPGLDEPSLRPGLDRDDISPGIEGFLMTALFVVLAVFVFRIMIKSIRRVKLRSSAAEDMLVERNQPRLTEEQRRRGDEPDELAADRTKTLQEKYPGYLRDDTLEPQEPDADNTDRR